MNSSDIRENGKKALNKNKKLLDLIKKRFSSEADEWFVDAHEEVFAHTDCLSCANCCKTTSPIFYEKDIERLASFLKISPGAFTEKYLCIDEDYDKVLKKTPCPFLNKDNCCSVYEARPKACREYPHTDRKNILQLAELTLKNSLICPAVQQILDKIRIHIERSWN